MRSMIDYLEIGKAWERMESKSTIFGFQRCVELLHGFNMKKAERRFQRSELLAAATKGVPERREGKFQKEEHL